MEELFTTAGGLRGHCQQNNLEPETALDAIWAGVGQRRGALFVSNYEVPDRYARWDIGFIDPPLAFVVKGRRFELNALNGEGERLLSIMAPALRDHPHLEGLDEQAHHVHGEACAPPAFFPEEERSRQPSAFSALRALLAHLRTEAEGLGFYGAFGYDLVFQFESLRMRMPRAAEQVDCCLFFATELVLVDRRMERARRLVYDFKTPLGSSRAGGAGGETFSPSPVLPFTQIRSDMKEGEFEEMVEQIRKGCRRGDFFEVVLSQTFSRPYAESPTELFARICQNNPSPYSFLINMGAEQLVGASPEMYVRVQGRRMETSPISGTVPVGDSPMETAAQIKHLIGSDKEESELTMCTDVDRNDMSRICEPGTVRLIGRRLIETYSRLVHTVDHVEGVLGAGYDAVDAFVTHLWACTVSGSPKPMALQTIEDKEKSPRRWYAGAVGFFSVNGDLNSGMTLRTVHLEGGLAQVRAGATLLFDSDPATEAQEARVKASAFLNALVSTPPAKTEAAAPGEVKPGAGYRVLLVDFLDSFVHTLASYLRITGAEVTTVRPEFPDALFAELRPDLVFLSPGPGTPAQRGVAAVIERTLQREIPLFGVCLGHQGIGEYFGASLGVAQVPMHGKPSLVHHKGGELFTDLPSPFEAGRYHSLYLIRDSLPPELDVLAETEDGVVMAMAHTSLPIASFQFHPESILTLRQQTGQRLIDNLFARFLPRVAKPTRCP